MSERNIKNTNKIVFFFFLLIIILIVVISLILILAKKNSANDIYVVIVTLIIIKYLSSFIVSNIYKQNNLLILNRSFFKEKIDLEKIENWSIIKLVDRISPLDDKERNYYVLKISTVNKVFYYPLIGLRLTYETKEEIYYALINIIPETKYTEQNIELDGALGIKSVLWYLFI